MNFRFCPKCGGTLVEKEAGLLVCEKCGFNFYQNSKPTACVILVNNEGKILLAKRGIEPFKGTWDLPGGFVSEGENFEEAAKREMKEEVGIEVSGLKYLGSYIDKYLYQDINFSVLCAVFVSSYNGEIIAMDDVQELTWCSKENIPWDNFGFSSMRKCLEDHFAAYG